MSSVKQIINEELQVFLNEVDNANFPSFGDHLRSISEVGEANQELMTTVLKEIKDFIKKYKKK
jgi:hypothetical protein